MSLILPTANEPLATGQHSYLHRVIAVDSAAPEQSLLVNANGSITMAIYTLGSIPFYGTSGNISQDNANLYFQDNNSTPSVLSSNTNVALSINASGDLSGSDAINVYAQIDAYLPNSAIGSLTTDGATPGFTASSSRGTGPIPVQLNANDFVGGFSAWAAQGAVSPTYTPVAGAYVYTTGASANNLGGEYRIYTKADGGALTQNMTVTNAGFVGIGSGLTGTNTTSLLTVDVENLGATLPVAAQGILLQNLTAATVSTTQNSPAISFSSNGWGTTAGTSQNVTFRINSTPVQGTVPSANLVIGSSTAGSAYAARLTISSAGNLTFTSGILTGAFTASGANAVITVTRTAIAGTSTDGVVVSNTTAALVGAQVQWSPRIRLSGTAWNTGGTPASNVDDFIIENQTLGGNPTSCTLVISSQLNAGGYVAQLKLSSAGVLTVTGGITIGSTTLLTSSVALTNNAGASAGTLTNAPAIGNPTKWIPINDNGTTRNIPAW